jgi:hypothetical protein
VGVVAPLVFAEDPGIGGTRVEQGRIVRVMVLRRVVMRETVPHPGKEKSEP